VSEKTTTTQAAEAAGRAAYAADQPRAAAANASVLALIGDSKVGDGTAIPTFKAFYHGYEAAAAEAAEAVITDDGE
jgi:hypothetical protein